MSKTYNNRQRADRFQGNRSYIHSPGSVEWWRGAFALAAIGLSVWFLWHFALSGSAKESGYRSSRGEVTFKHSAWNDKCDACHIPHQLSKEHDGLWDINGRWTDLSCIHCHTGPAHHTYRNTDDQDFDKNCAACHHDHSGKDYSLVRIADTHCTRCHAELTKHPNQFGNNDNYNPNIFHFGSSNGHPEFRRLEEEKKKPYERSLKFSHALHMSPGIDATMKLRNAWTLDRIKEFDKDNDHQYEARYKQFEKKGTKENGSEIDYIQLNCSSCHELDSGRKSNGPDGWMGLDKIVPDSPKESLLPPRAEGAYYLPVNFEKHCQACHPIAVNISSKEYGALDLKLPHRKQLKEFDETLKEKVTRAFLLATPTKTPTLPERLDKPLFPLSPEGKKAVEGLFDEAKKQLNAPIKEVVDRGNIAVQYAGTTCQKCHFPDPKNEGTVKPGNTPTVWFEHSKFSHVGHRAMNCAECHAGMGESPSLNAGGSLIWKDPEKGEFDRIGIDGIAKCQICHSPARKVGDTRIGGVRHDCTDCHRYHNAEYPLQGLGALSRDPEPSRSAIDARRGVNKDKPLLWSDPTRRLGLQQVLDGISNELRQRIEKKE